MLPEEGLKAFLDVDARRYFPVHWGMFTMNFHPWYEPPQKMSKFAQQHGFSFISLQLGETVEINDRYQNKLWWREKEQEKKD